MVYDILPEANLRDSDIRDTLVYHGGVLNADNNGFTDVRQFFGENARINKWARYKPESYKKNFGLTDEERFSNHYGLNLTSHQYLFGSASNIVVTDGKIDISNDKNGFLYKLCMGTLGGFEYILPQGGENSPYRLGDFRGYNPSAVNPLPYVADGTYKYTDVGAVDVPMTIATPVPNGLTMEILAFNTNTPLKDMYFGIVIYNDDLTDIIFGTQTADQKDKGRDVLTLINSQYATITNKRGTYKAKTFFSNTPIALNDYSATPSILLADDSVYTSVSLAPAYEAEVALTKEIKTISSAKYRLVVNVTNNTASAINVTSCSFLQSGNAYEDYADNVPLVIQAWQSGQVYFETPFKSDGFTATLVIDGNTYNV